MLFKLNILITILVIKGDRSFATKERLNDDFKSTKVDSRINALSETPKNSAPKVDSRINALSETTKNSAPKIGVQNIISNFPESSGLRESALTEKSNKDEDKTPNKCKEKKCIFKCCQENQHILMFKNCKEPKKHFKNLDFSDISLYDNSLSKTGKTLKDVYTIIPGIFSNITFKDMVDSHATILKYNHYLTEDGTLYEEKPNEWNRWTELNNDQFCVDYWIFKGVGTPELRFWTLKAPKVISQKASTTRENFITSGFLVSSVFLALVLLVYGLLPELRNLGGLLLMAYVVSLLGAFVLQAVLRIKGGSYCFVFTFFVYFFWIASFCWTNVMSWDIWWTFRGFAKAQLIHRRGELFKFGVYCAYAWGVPFSMSVALAVLANVSFRNVPWFIEPRLKNSINCFLSGPPKVLYLYTPMLIMSLANWMFFLLTVSNMKRLHRSTMVLDTAAGSLAAHRKQRQRLMVYLRLSVIMGINWALEVLSYFRPEDSLSYISDAFNVFLGMSIFLIFVCKRKIVAKLVKRYHGCVQSRRIHYRNRFSDTSESDVSNSPLQVCGDPNGPASAERRNSVIFKF